MKYIECPKTYRRDFRGDKPKLSLFLGGGITSCPEWQPIMVDLLKDTDLILLNPRRAEFDVTNPDIELEQITWEFNHMQRASAILFWFPCETLCPITLFEYGKWITQNKPLFVGCHPEYKRKRDLRIQTKLARKGQKIQESLENLAQEVREWYESY